MDIHTYVCSTNAQLQYNIDNYYYSYCYLVSSVVRMSSVAVCVRLLHKILIGDQSEPSVGRWMENFVLPCMPYVVLTQRAPGRFYGLNLKEEMVVVETRHGGR